MRKFSDFRNDNFIITIKEADTHKKVFTQTGQLDEIYEDAIAFITKKTGLTIKNIADGIRKGIDAYDRDYERRHGRPAKGK